MPDVHDHDDRHDRGLVYDLATLRSRSLRSVLIERRGALKLMGTGALGLFLVACGKDSGSGSATTSSSSTSSTSSTAAGGTGTTASTAAGSGEALDGAAVYLWHCDREGRYSLYSQGATDQNYLRGVQAAGSDGKLSFTSIYPAAYSGRWPHIHFEVFPSVSQTTTSGTHSPWRCDHRPPWPSSTLMIVPVTHSEAGDTR